MCAQEGLASGRITSSKSFRGGSVYDDDCVLLCCDEWWKLFWCESRKRRRLTWARAWHLALHTMALALHPTRACLSLTKRGGIVSSLQPPAFRLPPSFGLPNKFWVTNSIYSTLYVDVLQRHKPQLPPEVEAIRRNSYCITPLTTQHFFTYQLCTL